MSEIKKRIKEIQSRPPKDRDFVTTLFRRLKEPGVLARLDELRRKAESAAEDGVYRFYHQSFKVYHALQEVTVEAVEFFRSLFPDHKLNPWYFQIVAEGTGKEFDMSHNQEWLRHTRPMVEAFFHTRYFLDMMWKFVDVTKEVPGSVISSGCAAVLYLYNER